MLEEDPPFYQETMLRLAALVSCDIGISALNWSKSYLRPVQVLLGETVLLALATPACSSSEQYLCVQRGVHGAHGRDIVLVDAESGCMVGKCPDLLRDKTASLEEKEEWLRQLYPRETILVGGLA